MTCTCELFSLIYIHIYFVLNLMYSFFSVKIIVYFTFSVLIISMQAASKHPTDYVPFNIYCHSHTFSLRKGTKAILSYKLNLKKPFRQYHLFLFTAVHLIGRKIYLCALRIYFWNSSGTLNAKSTITVWI